jgi:hypothetical protein
MVGSNTKVKYQLMTSTASELTWVNQVLADLNLKSKEPMIMYRDNQTVRYITTNSVFHERIKHIEVDCHFIREKIHIKEIETLFVRSQNKLPTYL